MKRTSLSHLGCLLGGLLSVAACGSESSEGSAPADPGPTTSASPSTPAVDGGSERGAGDDGGGGGAQPDAGGEPAGALVPCGAVFCREGATCVSGACELPSCTGYRVPGDFATVQAAATAVGPGGGTICVGAGTFEEDVFVNGQSPVVVQGISPDKTTVRSFYLASNVVVNKEDWFAAPAEPPASPAGRAES